MPLHKDEAVQLVDAIVPYLEWQSDAAYKAAPPADYFYPAYDMFAALATVRANIVAGVYDSEYAFQHDLYIKVFGQGHDGHFVFYPDLLSGVFDYGRQRSLVSVSEDGKSAPQIKIYEDVLASPGTASAVVLINGIDAATYIENTVYAASYNQDADAAYNSMFFSKAMYGSGSGFGFFSGGGRIRFNYQGPNTTFTFANGTTATFQNFANVRASLEGITDGESMFDTFCAGANAFNAAGNATRTAPSTTSSAPTATRTAVHGPSGGVIVPGYPEPVDITDDAIVSCYFLDGAGYEDVAVLALLAFESESPAEFQAVTDNCIAQARAAGKTKLVVDLSANGGGYILQGYDFFRQLFPKVVQDGFSRWKANDGFVAIAEIVSALSAGLDPYTSRDEDAIAEYQSWFNYRYDLNLTNEKFADFAAKFGPYVVQDTNYTAIMRWNLDDSLTTTNSTFGMGIEITGYGSRANLTQPFGADDIVLLYDGVCASTCTLASEMLRIQGGVRSVALGGRPEQPRALIQGVGGIKGAQILQFGSIFQYTQLAISKATTDAQRAALARYNELPVLRSVTAAVNVRDQILRGNVRDGLPAQFVREDSDCRLFYSAAMAADVTAVWKSAAHAAFDSGACAAGYISQEKVPAPAARRTRRTAPLAAAGVDHASLARRKVVAEAKAAGRLSPDLANSERFQAQFNQKAIE